MTTSETLIKARDLLAQGWCQGVAWIHNKNGGYTYCIFGALEKSKDNQKALFEARDFIYGALARRQYEKDIEDFNDAPGRTQAEILKLMDDAIELAKQEESEQ